MPLVSQNAVPEIHFSPVEPVLNLRDPMLFPTDGCEDADLGVRPPKASIAKAQLQPRDRRTAGPAGWGKFSELNAALDAHARRVGWKATSKANSTRWIRGRVYERLPAHSETGLARAA